MENPKDTKGKVIIIPRPPRASNQEWVPVNPATEATETVEAIDPHAGSLGPNAVTGPQASPFGELMGAAPAAPATEEAGEESEE